MKSFSVVAVISVALALAVPAVGQWRGRGYSRYNAERLIRQAENRSDVFVRLFERALDRSPFEGSRREERLNDRAMEMESHLNLARQEVNRTNNYYSVRSHVASAIDVAQGINNVMRSRQFNPGVERQWMLLRSDLNRLAVVYNLRQVRY
jgi:hypothetical protein